MITMLNKKIQSLDIWDMAFTKLGIMFFMMFIFSVWGGFRDVVLSINPWILCLVWIIFVIKPLKRFLSK